MAFTNLSAPNNGWSDWYKSEQAYFVGEIPFSESYSFGFIPDTDWANGPYHVQIIYPSNSSYVMEEQVYSKDGDFAFTIPANNAGHVYFRVMSASTLPTGIRIVDNQEFNAVPENEVPTWVPFDLNYIEPDPTFPVFKFLPEWMPPIMNDFFDAEQQASPLVLDIDGDGIELVALNDAGSVYWDIDLDNFAEASGWITGGDGLLAIDLNVDGVINNHSELFGNQNDSLNGFATLSVYDTNSDNAITSADAQFFDLLIWIDINADGYSQSSELYTLDDLGITSISTNFTNVNYMISGNEIKQESTFTINGQTQSIVDAWFTYDNANTTYVGDYTLDIRTLFLPTLRGFGNLPDLHIAMSQDETLLIMVQELATANTETILSADFDLQSKIEEIMFRWAGVDEVDPASRGIVIDGQHMGFLEVLADEEWQQVNATANPGPTPGKILNDIFQQSFTKIASQLLMQTGAKEVFSDVTAKYNLLTGEVENSASMEYIKFLNDYNGVMYSAVGNGDGNQDESYVYYDGDGSDIIMEYGGVDQIIFGTGISVNDVAISKSADNLMLTIGADTITIQYHFCSYNNYEYAIESALFADGTVVDLLNNIIFTGTDGEDLVYGLYDSDDILIGLAGNDTLSGQSGNNILNGGMGNDTLYGGEGNDIYIYNLGDGSDIIMEYGGVDQIIFGTGISVNDVAISKSADNLMLTIGADTITIQYHFCSYNNYEYAIESALFADGTVVDLLNNIIFTGTDGEDLVYGLYDSDDILIGLAGNDTLSGQSGNNILNGGMGNDTLYGGEGNDILNGGIGNDNLNGYLGNDTYIYNLGDGSDIILENGGLDQIVFGADISLNDINLFKSGNDLKLFIGDDTITIQYQFHSDTDYVIEKAIFADGSELDFSNYFDWKFGTTVGETINGSYYLDDTILAGDGDDKLYGKDGNDYLYGGMGDDYLSGDNGDDFLHGGAGNDILRGREDNDILVGGTGDDILIGGSNSSDIFSSNDILDGGAGNDTLKGALGDDVYVASSGLDHVYDTGGNDVIQFGIGIKIDDLTFIINPFDTNDLTIVLNAGIDEIEIENQRDTSGSLQIETLLFDDGSSANFANYNDWIFGTTSDDIFHGNYSKDDTMIGGKGNDILYGKDGDDELFGGDDNDYLSGDAGNDYLYGGAGHDDLRGYDGNDILFAGAGNDRLAGYDGADTFAFSGTEILDGNLNRVVDFNVLEGDIISFRDVLEEYDPITDVISDFISLKETSHTYIKIDRDGTGTEYASEYVVRIENFSGQWTDVDDMITQGHLEMM